MNPATAAAIGNLLAQGLVGIVLIAIPCLLLWLMWRGGNAIRIVLLLAVAALAVEFKVLALNGGTISVAPGVPAKRWYVGYYVASWWYWGGVYYPIYASYYYQAY